MFCYENYGQYHVFLQPENMESLKKRKLYVALGDKDALLSKPYVEMIEKFGQCLRLSL